MSQDFSPYYGHEREARDSSLGAGPPANHLVMAVLATFFCCLVPGILSIVYAAQVNRQYYMGDTYGALEASASAKNWAIAAIVLGLFSTAPSIIFLLLSLPAGGSR